MRRIQTIRDGERDGERHYHADSKWGESTRWSQTPHLVNKNHKRANLTNEGRALHFRHQSELRLEIATRTWQVRTAEYQDVCRRCKKVINAGDTIQWHPRLKVKCAPDTACGKNEDGLFDGDDEEVADAKAPPPKEPRKADKEDFENFSKQLEQMGVAVNEAKAQAATAEERADDAENATRDALDLLEKVREIEVVVREPGKKPKRTKIKDCHEHFEKLLRNVGAQINTALVGDTGSGKTYGGMQVAEALKLPYYHMPLGPQTSKSDLLGYMSGTGKYVESLLRTAYEQGGVVLLDEMDAANAAILTIINGMLDAEVAGFPDGMVKRHKNTRFIAAMNTYGRGADMLYVGRAQLDAATLSRWAYVEWNTDWGLAHMLIDKKHKDWVQYVESLSKSIAKQGVRAIIGMRTALMGVRLLEEKVDREEVEQEIIWQPISRDDKEKILAGVEKKKEPNAAASDDDIRWK